MTTNKPPVGPTNAPRCSIRVLSQGNNVIIAQGSGKGTPAKSAVVEAVEPKPVNPLRKTRFFRLDQIKNA